MFRGESSITSSGGAPIAQKVFVNGIEESLLSVTIDGARQNKSAFHHTGNVLIDPALLKKVEVSEGIAPADAGPQSLGGGIAYTTKDARDLLDAGETFGGFTRLSFGDNGSTGRASTFIYGMNGNFEWLLGGSITRGSEYKNGDGDTVTGTEADLSDFNLKLAHTSDSGKRISLSASKTEDSGQRSAQSHPVFGFLIRPDFEELTTTPTVLIDALSKRESLSFSYVDENPDGDFAPEVQLNYNKQTMDAGGLTGINTSVSGTVKNDFQLGNGTLTAGLDFFDESAESVELGGREDVLNFGAFVQMRQDLSDRVSVSYGARADWSRFEGVNGEEFEDAGLSANAAIDVILNDNWSLNAGLASSWGGYELGEAVLARSVWDYTGFTSSRANAARVGLRYDNGPIEASGALFYTEINDLNWVLPLDGTSRGMQDDVISKGFDGSFRYTGEHGFAALNYTYADVDLNGATIGTTNYYLGKPVGHIIGIEAAFDVNDAWQLGALAEIALDNDDTTVPLDGYEVIDLYAVYKPKEVENFQVRFDVRNLFDETYVSRSADGVGNPNVVPLTEPGRTLAVTATYRF